MRITVNYGWKSFGNGTTPQSYTARVYSSKYGVSVVFSFDRSVKGIGGFTENSSRISSASLHMPQEHAKALAEAILQALSLDDRHEVALQFG